MAIGTKQGLPLSPTPTVLYTGFEKVVHLTFFNSSNASRTIDIVNDKGSVTIIVEGDSFAAWFTMRVKSVTARCTGNGVWAAVLEAA